MDYVAFCLTGYTHKIKMRSKTTTFIKKESDDDKIGSKDETFYETSVAV
jgi:hypothetical protein